VAEQGPPAPLTERAIPAEWDACLARLPVDLEESAYRTQALRRKRQVRQASDLLRLVLAYSLWDWSLRLVGAWAVVMQIANLSDVAVRKRLRGTRRWLGELVGAWVRQRSGLAAQAGVRLRLIDATVITQPGSQGTDWRVHLSFDVGRMCLDGVEISDASGGETLVRHAAAPGEIEVGDRGYAHRRGVGSVLARGGSLVVRINGHNLPLETPAGRPLKLARWLRQIPAGQTAERWVQVQTPDGCFAIRLVVRRLPRAAATAARQRLRQASRKKGHTPSATSLALAGGLVLVSNLPAASWSAAQVVDLYRVRWQVELAIKRLKSLLQFDHLRTKEPELAQVYLLAKLVAAVWIDAQTTQHVVQQPDWWEDTTRPVSLWRWQQLWFESLRAVVRGPLSPAQLLAALPRLARYLRDGPRQRTQQLAHTRHLLRLTAALT
jgi:hypothetical protein